MARPGLTQHRKFRRLARALGGPIVARGVLELMWDACYEAGEDYVGTADDVDALINWTGKPGEVALALVAAGIPEGHGFLEPIQPVRDGDPIRYRVHDLWHHAPEYVTKRRRREESRRTRSDPARPLSAERPPSDGRWRGSPDCQIAVPPPPARGAGASEGSGSISEEGGLGETFRFDVAFQKLKSVYPPNRVTSGPQTEQAFYDVIDRAGGDPWAVFGRMLSNLATQKAGQQWQDTDMIPKLLNWLTSGLWEQVHEPAQTKDAARMPAWAQQAQARARQV